MIFIYQCNLEACKTSVKTEQVIDIYKKKKKKKKKKKYRNFLS